MVRIGAGWIGSTLLVVALAAPSGAATPRDAFGRYQKAVCAVTYYVETSFMREVREVAGRELGVVVGTDLVMLNGSVATTSSTGAQPHSFRIRFATGEERDGAWVGRDEFANVAFLRFAGGLPRDVTPVRFDKNPKLRVGDAIYSIALLPPNLEPMSRLEAGHVIAAVERPKGFLVTDLPTDGGLGGPVFDGRGTLLGVLSEIGEAGPSFAAGFAGDGEVGFGIVVDAPVLARLVADPPVRGATHRAWLGITLQALDHDKAAYWNLGNATGIIVNSVMPGSPAAAAGLQPGDVVLSMNGEPIPVSEEDHVPIFIESIGSRPVGSDLVLGVWRHGKRMTTDVALVAAPKSRLDAETYHSPDFELTVRELVFQDARVFDLPPDFKGVVVSKIKDGGWAGVGGLETGDIIQKVDDHGIERPTDLRSVLEDASVKRKRKIVFFVQRQGRTQFITVQPNWSGES